MNVETMKVIAAPKADEGTVALVARAVEVQNRMAKLPPIADDDGSRAATELVVEAKKIDDALEARRKEFALPVDRMLSEFNSHFRSARMPLTEATTRVSRAIAKYESDKLERERRRIMELEETARKKREDAERARLAAEAPPPAPPAAAGAASAEEEDDGLGDLRQAAAASDAKAADADANRAEVELALAKAAPPPSTTTRVAGGSASVRKEWTFEVVDLAIVPREIQVGEAKATLLVLDESLVRRLIKSAGVRSIPGLRIYQDAGLAVKR